MRFGFVVLLLSLSAATIEASVVDCTATPVYNLKRLLQIKSKAALEDLTSKQHEKRNMCRSCQFQIQHKLLPLYCYHLLDVSAPSGAQAGIQSTTEIEVKGLDRLCGQWAASEVKIESLQAFANNLVLSRSCRQHIKRQEKLLLYRMKRSI